MDLFLLVTKLDYIYSCTLILDIEKKKEVPTKLSVTLYHIKQSILVWIKLAQIIYQE